MESRGVEIVFSKGKNAKKHEFMKKKVFVRKMSSWVLYALKITFIYD